MGEGKLRIVVLLLGWMVGEASPVFAQGPLPLDLGFEVSGPSGFRGAVALAIARDLPSLDHAEENAFFVRVSSPSGYLPSSIGIWTTDGAGEPLDQLGPVPLELGTCRDQAPPAACGRAGPIRLVPGAVDRGHPGLLEASVVARVGGRVLVEAGGHQLTAQVTAPEALGGGVHQFRLRAQVVRTQPGGGAATGTDDARAVELGRAALAEAASPWGQCGFAWGPRADDVRVVDPPRGALLEIGCHGGLPAGGGALALVVRGRTLKLSLRPGEGPGSVATRLAQELRRRGVDVTVTENPTTEQSAGPSYDVLVPAGRSGPLLRLPDDGALSTDPTLGVCAGELDLGDGLDHFEDETARAGSLEERALLRGLVDADPATIDVVLVPYFSGRGRIGESFIGEGSSSLESLVILDRAGVRASVRSSTLAHEIGHVLLAQPGHPDDFGKDTPDRLMDADASDPTAFGPRRLTLEECERALRQHGPGSPLPLLELAPSIAGGR